MVLLEVFKKYIIFFYMCGISQYNPNKVTTTTTVAILRNFVPLITLISCVTIFCFFLWTVAISDTKSFHMDGSTNNLIARMFVLFVLASNLVAIVLALLNKNAILTMMLHFLTTEKLLQLYFQRRMNMSDMSRPFRLKVSIVLSSYVLSATFYASTYYTDPDDIPAYICVYTAQTFAMLVSLHIVFLAELTTSILKEMTECVALPFSVNKISDNRTDLYTARLKIKLIKKLYFEIWKITQMISDCFGLNLMNITVYFMMDTTYDIYWLYIIGHTYHGVINAARKLNFFNLNCSHLNILFYLFPEAIFCMIYPVTCASVLVDSCHHCSVEVIIIK